MRDRAFTLIEIMVVVLIIGLLATLVGPHVFTIGREAERELALAKCSQYHGAVNMWLMHKRTSRVPASLEELETPLRAGEPNFLRVEPDPWGGAYRIVTEEGRKFRIWSDGPDGEPDTDDDICYEPLDD